MATYKIKGHESFMVREGWLTKGLIGVEGDNAIFSDLIKATEVLEVGANMVKSIRYWMNAFGLTEEIRNHGVLLSDLGNVVIDNDKYIEDDFTLWLLHSNIAKNKEKATTWYLFFNKCIVNEFTKEQLLPPMRRDLIAYAETDQFAETSLKSDIDVLLNMYSRQGKNDDPEDKNQSPFARLGLIKNDGNSYLRQQPRLNRFSEFIILYELSCMFYDHETDDNMSVESVSIDKIAEVAFNLYNLTRVNINMILDRLDNDGYIRVDRTAGLDVIYPINIKEPLETVGDYYNNRN